MTDPNNPDMQTLAQCPIGLFLAGDELCLKTEYGNNEGRIDAYIVSSGEFFWGSQPQTIANQRMQIVVPVDADALISRHREQQTARSGDVGREALEEALAVITSGNIMNARSNGDLHGWCERIRNRIRAALTTPPADDGGLLPCDVTVHPATTFKAGVKLSTLLACIEDRRTFYGGQE